MGKQLDKNFLPMQPGDVLSTYADISGLERDYGFKPQTSIDEGIGKFVDWYKNFIMFLFRKILVLFLYFVSPI